MIKAVLDTNQYVSALIKPNGPQSELIKMASGGLYSIVLSSPLLEEIFRALTYPRIRKYLSFSQNEIEEFFESLLEICEITPGELLVEVVKNDPDDNKIIGCALEGMADFVVTRDHDLLKIKKYENIQIVTAREFMNILEDNKTKSF